MCDHYECPFHQTSYVVTGSDEDAFERLLPQSFDSTRLLFGVVKIRNSVKK